jgi:diacylglycerol O-acyltransferase / wax synthase
MALNVTVQSYAGRLDYGLIACRRAVPDVNDLGDHLLAEHQALLERAHEHAQSLDPNDAATHAPTRVQSLAAASAAAPVDVNVKPAKSKPKPIKKAR